MKLLLLSLLFSACATHSSLNSPEGPIQFDIENRTYKSSHEFRMSGPHVINKRMYNFIQLTFLKGHFLAETYLHAMEDTKKANADGKYSGKVSMTKVAYKVLKTSRNEFIVKIAEYSSQKRSYNGAIRSPRDWNLVDMGPWQKNDFTLSGAELKSTYKFTLLENGKILEGTVLFNEMIDERFREIVFR